MDQRFPKVNYAVRPAKAAERHMIVETLTKLGLMMPLAQYRYVGMGSVFFQDFMLIHRRLGIEDMVSMESEQEYEKRIHFNVPLACIRVEMGMASDVLRDLRLGEKPHIVWLDYESRVEADVLEDLGYLIHHLCPGSAVIITVNVGVPRRKQRRVWKELLERVMVGVDVPKEVPDVRALSYQMLRRCVVDAIDGRNNVLRRGKEAVEFHQVWHFAYSDGAPMMTFGGVVVDDKLAEAWDGCRAEMAGLCVDGEIALDMRIPFLTRKEVSTLVASFPKGDEAVFADLADEVGLDVEDVRQLARLYRYVPLYVEAEGW